MALTLQDFTKGIDFTALVSGAAGDHNNLVDLAIPTSDSASEGKGIILWTVDSALNTPIVPSIVFAAKWKRYLWLRIPHATSPTLQPTIYGWNDNAVNDATYGKWLNLGSDLTALQAQINTALADAASAMTTANNANNTANTAATQAATALANANNALAQVADVTTDVNNAVTTANAASATAVDAQSQANAALAAANAKKAPTDALTPGTPFQTIQTNGGGTGVDWVNSPVLQTLVKIITTEFDVITVIPLDNTKPQVGEGDEIGSIVIAPKLATSYIRITLSAYVDTSGAGSVVTLALFKNGAADALYAVAVNCDDIINATTLDFLVPSGVATANQTFSVRMGPDAGHGYLNRNGAGSLYGGVSKCIMTVQEINATVS